MIVLASLNDKAAHRGTVYATTYKAIEGLPILDFLRPTHELVHGWKYWGETWAWYTDGYRKLLQARWPDVKPWLDSLSPDVDLTLVCFCGPHQPQCHRQLIAQMLVRHRPDIPLDIR